MNTRGDKIRDIAAVKRNILYNRRAQIGKARVTRQKNGVERGVQLSVRQRHLEFVFEVRHRPKSPYDRRSAEIRKAANDYVENIMKRTDDAITAQITELRKSRQNLRITKKA